MADLEPYEARYYHTDDDGRLHCTLCPRECKLRDGQRAFCFVRQNIGGRMILTTYGRSSGFCIDPIEKKPLNHFYPGTSVLSFGTAGCNLGCQFCQNWSISKAKAFDRVAATASPQAIADAAIEHECHSVAFTYNDPVIFAEYAIDVANACRAQGIKTVGVTAGYITEAARGEFFDAMDAVNVDLKAFHAEFYRKIAYGALQPVLDTLKFLAQTQRTWFEITTLLIPGKNDSKQEIDDQCRWLRDHVGPDVPLHFTAFHPDFRMSNIPPTPPETLHRARQQALDAGLHYVYTGNVHDTHSQSTYCPGCHQLLIERNWYKLGAYRLAAQTCSRCGYQIAGRFGRSKGTWGARRLPVMIGG